jgi:hypothetical protein
MRQLEELDKGLTHSFGPRFPWHDLKFIGGKPLGAKRNEKFDSVDQIQIQM